MASGSEEIEQHEHKRKPSAGDVSEPLRGTQPDPRLVDTLTTEFDSLLEGMQTPHAKAGLRDAFNASPDELALAAVAAALRRTM